MTVTFDRDLTIRLRPKNQVTIPEALTRQLDVEPGDRLFARVEAPGRLVLRKVPKSFHGALAGLWGTQEEIDAEIRAGRDEWDERERRLFGEPEPR
jgi:bifunctional DNA-binding transcriptional regulator/antitoxin component of YhaV-PrlF toxin-antitoxin module